MQLFSIHKKEDESYIDLYQRAKSANAKINRVTPRALTAEQRSEELTLFTILNALPADDRLRNQLISQKDVSLSDAFHSFLRTDKDTALKGATKELAHAAFGRNCFLCKSPNHFEKDCPHRDAITNLISRRNGGGDGRGRRGRGRGNGHSGNGHANVASTTNNMNETSTSPTTATNGNASANKSPSQESAGVASALLSRDSHLANIWLCDSGASSSMSCVRSAFSSLKSDRRPIRLADGKVIYSEGCCKQRASWPYPNGSQHGHHTILRHFYM